VSLRVGSKVEVLTSLAATTWSFGDRGVVSSIDPTADGALDVPCVLVSLPGVPRPDDARWFTFQELREITVIEEIGEILL